MHKRIIGSAIIMVLTVSQVLFSFPFNLPEVKQAHAATRLGLHVTQEELNIWRSRRNDTSNGINGQTYKDIWDNRILPDANNFRGQSHPGGDGHWDGYTGGGCIPWGQSEVPGRGNGRQLMSSAFVFLITGDTTYATPVKTELLNQITQAGTNFGNTGKYCVTNQDGSTFEIAPWVMRLILAYDYLNAGGYTGFTSQNHSDILTWIHNAGMFFDAKATIQITQNVFGGARNATADYTCTGFACPGGQTTDTHWQGYHVYDA